MLPLRDNKCIMSDLEKHFKKLLKAISKVPYAYLKAEYLEDVRLSNKEKQFVKTQVERVFAYELYHQWSNLLGSNSPLVLNGETRKDFEKVVYLKKKYYYPDMVLHHKDVLSSDSNMLVCEIKRKDNLDGMEEDIKKLSMFLSEKLRPKKQNLSWRPYKRGVFLIIDSSNEDVINWENLKDKLRGCDLSKIDYKTRSQIYCIIYNGNEQIPDTKTLAELLV